MTSGGKIMAKPQQPPAAAPKPAVPFFARKAGRATLTVRAGVRAGAREAAKK
jgi:hypothetical protein